MNGWGNTFTKQAVKILNSRVDETVPLLMSEVEHLKGVVLLQDEKLNQLQVINAKQEKEIMEWRQYSEANTEIEAIIREFGTCGENLGWNGWSHRGYRAVDGTLHRDINAIASFISDLQQEYCAAPFTVFQD